MAECKSEPAVFEKPKEKWSDVHGLDHMKRELKFYATFNQKFISNGVILFGPPGTGKTTLARGLANEFGELHFISLRGRKVCQGDLHTAFSQARKHAPAILHIEECEAIASLLPENLCKTKDGCINQEFVQEMELTQERESNVLVLIETNAPWQMDMTMLKKYFRADIYFQNITAEDMKTFLMKSFLKADRFGDDLNKQSFSPIFFQEMHGFTIQHVDEIVAAAIQQRAKRYTRRAKVNHVKPYNKLICDQKYEWIPCNSDEENSTPIFSSQFKLNVDLTKVFIPPDFPMIITDVSNAVNEIRAIRNVSTAQVKKYVAFQRELYKSWTPYKFVQDSSQGAIPKTRLLSVLQI